VALFAPASGPGIRNDAGLESGDEVTVYYDPMLAKLIVTGRDRAEAVRKLQTALYEFEVGGIATNIPFLRRLVASQGYVDGEFTTAYVPAFLSENA
jgi:acetyl/propionyl-CoA carboxylase alpha subunit